MVNSQWKGENSTSEKLYFRGPNSSTSERALQITELAITNYMAIFC